MVSMIWAEDLNGAIGNQNQLLWHVPEDLKLFKESTKGQTVIMGSNTWRSLPVSPLPSRVNVVLSRSGSAEDFQGAFLRRSVDEVVSEYPEGWVMGGESVYEAFMPYCDVIYRTIIRKEAAQADSFAPAGWESEFEQFYSKVYVDILSDIVCEFQRWSRKV